MKNLQELPIFPLGTVLFPGMVLPLHIFEERYKLMINRCIKEQSPFGVILIQEGSPSQVFDIGTIGHITQVEHLSEGRMNIATLGVRRFKIHEVISTREPYLIGLVEDFPFDESESIPKTELSTIEESLRRYLKVLSKASDSDLQINDLPQDAIALACLIAIVLQTPMSDKQNLLSIAGVADLLEAEKKLLLSETAMLKLLTHQPPNWLEDWQVFSPN